MRFKRLAHAILAVTTLLASAAACGPNQDYSSQLADSPLANRERARQEARDYRGADPTKTPGDMCDERDADFDGFRYEARIAHCGRSVSRSTKVRVAASYGVAEDSMRNYEVDHWLSLNIGGSNEETNLWPLYKPIARLKSQAEQQNMDAVANGSRTQAAAVQFLKDWRPDPDAAAEIALR